ncbi:MAG: hypothetical protein WBC78_18345, partial [Candidatus Sulfotelmatobacter sp.]
MTANCKVFATVREAVAVCESELEDPVTTTLLLPCGVAAPTPVVIVIVTAVGLFPGVTTALGAKMHVELAGFPLQERLTAPEKAAPTGV